MADIELEPLSPEEAAVLRQEVQRANAERDAANQRADHVDGQLRQSSQKIAESQVATLAANERQAEQSVASLNSEIATLGAQRTLLLQEGKFEEERELNEKISVAIANRQQALQAQTYYKGQRETAAAQPTDPVERFIAANKFSDQEQDWIRRHPRYATDKGFLERVNTAHGGAISKGLARFSPEYFKALEDAGYQRQDAPIPAARAAGRAPDDDGSAGDPDNNDDGSPYSGAAGDDDNNGDGQVEQQQVRQPPRSGGAARPSSRSPTTPPGRRQGEIRLTPEQTAAALAAAEYFPVEVQNEGEAGIFAYWAKLNGSSMARRLRESWRTGG